MIKYYKAISGSRSALVVNTSEIASFQPVCGTPDDDLCQVEMIIQGVEVVYYLFNDEIEDIIADIKVGNAPQYEITNLDDFVNKPGSCAIGKLT